MQCSQLRLRNYEGVGDVDLLALLSDQLAVQGNDGTVKLAKLGRFRFDLGFC